LQLSKPGSPPPQRVDISKLSGAEGAKLAFGVESYLILRRVDTRSFRGGVAEQRALIVPIGGLASQQASQAETEMGARFVGEPKRAGPYLFVECQAVLE